RAGQPRILRTLQGRHQLPQLAEQLGQIDVVQRQLAVEVRLLRPRLRDLRPHGRARLDVDAAAVAAQVHVDRPPGREAKEARLLDARGAVAGHLWAVRAEGPGQVGLAARLAVDDA